VTLNNLAWILATHPQAELRNGEEAVRLAERACDATRQKDPRLLGTLAAAYAEAGLFQDAIKTAQNTHDLALPAGEREIANAAHERVTLYESAKPYRQQ
jgi:hypothetical protein